MPAPRHPEPRVLSTVTIWQVRGPGDWKFANVDVAVMVAALGGDRVRLADVPDDVRPLWRRRPHHQRREITARRLAAAKRALQRQADQAGLFADFVVMEQPAPEQRIAQWDDRGDAMEMSFRQSDARSWRDARRILASLDRVTRALLIHAWNGIEYPRDASYFVSFVQSKLKENRP